jgi:vacuolar protein sorting-associated protein 13A/C
MYFSSEVAEEAITVDELTETAKPQPPTGEICLLSSPSIVVSLEMDIGNETIPVLVMQASLNGQIKDWSSDVSRKISWKAT